MSDDSLAPVVAALVALVEPASVVEVDTAGTGWAEAFRRAGIESTLVAVDPQSPFTVEKRADLVVSVGVGDRLAPDVAPMHVGSLCQAGEVVAFSAASPGLAPDAPNARWPAWWDSHFADHGYVAHDVVRPLLWTDDRVAVDVRQGLVLYGPPDRFPPPVLPAGPSRHAVHPEAHQRAMELAARRDDTHVAEANRRLAELDGELGRLTEHARLLELDLEAMHLAHPDAPPSIDGLSPTESQLLVAETAAREARSEAVLLWAALAAAHRELAAESYARLPGIGAARMRPKFILARSLTSALPVRRALRRVIGPSAVLFDEHFYLSRYPDVTASALSPLWHYRRHGARSRRAPHPFFDPSWYAERYPDAVGDGPDPVEDYVRRGWRDGRDPHPLFSGAWYATQADLTRWKRSPLEHYLAKGNGAGLSPHPLIDPAWYLEDNPDLAAAGVDPVAHFLTRGWWEGRSPHPLFDVRWYLETHEHIAVLGLNPLVDYVSAGWREGRDPNELFDVDWYLEANPDVAAAGVEPLGHYLVHGAVEGRATGPLFDTAWYVAAHPEAAEGGRNPLEFFLRVGAARGDVPSPWSANLGGRDERLGM